MIYMIVDPIDVLFKSTFNVAGPANPTDPNQLDMQQNVFYIRHTTRLAR